MDTDFLSTGDENIVNAYIVLLLSQCSRLCRQYSARWTMDRVLLEANIKHFRAYTDGALR